MSRVANKEQDCVASRANICKGLQREEQTMGAQFATNTQNEGALN